MQRLGWLWSALLLTLVVECVVALRSPAIALDSVTYIEIAQALEVDPVSAMRTEDQHPGYPALIALTHAILGGNSVSSWVFAGRFVSIVAGAGCVVFVWLIARRMYNEQVANLACLLAAGLPSLRQNAADVLSDTPHLCAYLGAAWLVQEGFARSSWRWFAAGGVMSGLAFWIRPEGLSVALVAGALLTLALIVRALPRRVAFVSLMAVTAGAMLVVGPYVLLSGKLTSKKDPFAVTQKPAAIDLPYMSAPLEPNVAANAAVLESAPELAKLGVSPTIAVTPPPSGSIGDRLPSALEKYFVELGYGFGYVVWIPWFLGHIGPGRLRPRFSSVTLMAGLGALHSLLVIWLVVTAGYLGHRHVMPIIGVALPTAASGLECFGRLMGRLMRRLEWSPRFATLTALILVAVAVPFGLREINAVATPVVAASEWIAARSAPGESVIANSPYPRFYAQLQGPIYGIEVTDLPAALATQRPEFVLLDIDARSFAVPDADDLGPEYQRTLETGGEGKRSWHRVVVFQRIASPTRQAAAGSAQR